MKLKKLITLPEFLHYIIIFVILMAYFYFIGNSIKYTLISFVLGFIVLVVVDKIVEKLLKIK